MKNLFLFISLVFVLVSCTDDGVKVPNVDNITLDNKLIRFDQELIGQDNFAKIEKIEELREKYPAFANLYFGPILHLVDQNTGEYVASDVKNFTTDALISGLQDTIEQTFSDFGKQTRNINQAFKLLKHYFPEYPTPNVYFSNTLFNYQRFIFSDEGRDGIGIGLDMFCNEIVDYKSIDPTNPVFSEYLTRSFNPDHLVKKILDPVLEELCGESPGVRLIDQMIHNGKIHYIMDLLLPRVNDTIIMEYSAPQMEWTMDNQLEMWSFYLDKELFYESNQSKISKYINPSPNAPGMPMEAPGRTANYLGWQIVKSYMQKFPDTSLRELIGLQDSQKLLEESSYRPKRKN